MRYTKLAFTGVVIYLGFKIMFAAVSYLNNLVSAVTG